MDSGFTLRVPRNDEGCYGGAQKEIKHPPPKKTPRHPSRGFAFPGSFERLDQKSMPPMPPPGGMPPAPPPAFFFGSSAIMASVVISSAATEAAFWIAARTTLVGSMMPLVTRLPYSPVWLSKPKAY